MARRPPGLMLQPVVAHPADSNMKITDTMTLVVKGDDGQELRVKESGIAQGTPPIGTTPLSAVGKGGTTESLMNKVAFDDLKSLEILGAGSQGKVRKVQHKKTGDLFAVKSIAFGDDKEAVRAMVRGELKRVEALTHPNVVTSFEAFFREGKLYIVLEFMDCGTMTAVMKKAGGFPENVLAYVARELLTGINHLHTSGVIHRDLKPPNVLLNSKGEVKISDFGVAKDFSKEKAAETLAAVGSTPYMSPERIRALPYTFSCDIWSFGLTIAECAIGAYPFGDLKSKIFELCQTIASNQARVQWELAPNRQFSPELLDFVAQCLRPVEQRPSAQDLLGHPFLEKGRALAAADVGRWFADPTSAAP